MYKLILADDEAVIRRGLSLLRWDELGFHLAEAFADGGEVIDYLKREGADVVMPHVSGIEVARWVYENAPQTKVVLLSGYAEFKDAQKAIEYHVSRYLLKPTDRDELAAQFRTIRQELDGREDADGAQEGSLQQKIDLYLDRHLADGASLTGAAEFVHMNPAHLSRAFKEETGENYNNYALRRRMDAAKRLLVESDLQVQEICRRVGYSDVRYFTRIFRETTGVSPSHFRRRSVRGEK